MARHSIRGDDIAERMLLFSARIIRLTNALPRSFAARHIAGQIVRSGTSPGANYEEARAAESSRDFVHKLGICLKELRETLYWLRVIAQSGLLPKSKVEEIIGEADELCRIVAASILTAKKGKEKSKQTQDAATE